MPTPLWLGLATEASGTTLGDTSSGTAVNLTITAGGTGSWTTDNAGNEYHWVGSTNTGNFLGTASGTKIATALNGGKTVCIEAAINLASGYTASSLHTWGPGLFIATDDGISLQWPATAEADNTHLKVASVLNGTDGNYSEWPIIAAGYHVLHLFLDTSATAAADRIIGYLDGFKAALTQNEAVPPQNSTLGSMATLETGALSLVGGTDAFQGYGYAAGALYTAPFANSGSACADALSHALRLFGTNDADPNASGAQMRAASTNGGTNDVSTSVADHSLSFTITIGASNKRKVVLPIAYFGVTSGVTAITFNGSSTGVHLSAQQQVTSGSLMGCDIYEILDADLPGSGTYTIAITVDGASGVACGSPSYLEGVAQSYATNTALATGTGTSITATLGSAAVAGSIMVGQLLDVTVADAPVSGANQLRLVSQTTSSAIRQQVEGKFVPTAGSNSFSWTGLTNATQKVAVVIEAQAAFTPASIGWLETPSINPRKRAALTDMIAPVGTLMAAAALTSIGWYPPEPAARKPPTPPRVEQSQPIGTRIFVPSNFGWYSAEQQRPSRASNVAWVVLADGNAGSPAFISAWFDDSFTLSRIPQKIIRTDPSAPVGALFSAALPNIGWMTADTPRATTRARAVEPSAPVGALLTPTQASGLSWDALPQSHLPLPRPPAMQPSAPVGALLTPTQASGLSWLTTDNPRISAQGRTVDVVAPVGAMIAAPLTSLGWLTNESRQLAQSRPPLTPSAEPVGARFALAQLGWLVTEYQRGSSALHQTAPVDPVGAAFAPLVLTSLAWNSFDLREGALLQPQRQSPSEPIATLMTPSAASGFAAWSTVEQPRRAQTTRTADVSIPVGSMLTGSLPALGWLAYDLRSSPPPRGTAQAPVDPVGGILFGGSPWANVEQPRAIPRRPADSTVAPVGALIPPPVLPSLGWQSVVIIPPQRHYPPTMTPVIAPIGPAMPISALFAQPNRIASVSRQIRKAKL